MNIAVCISGGIRYPHHGLNSIKRILPNKNIKVFIHTWKVNDIESFKTTLSGIDTKENDKLIENNYGLLDDYNYEKILIEEYENKKPIFEKYKYSLNFIPATDPEDTNPRNDIGPISMYYSLYKANELKTNYEIENNIIFDWVIRMRTDSDFKNYLDLNLMSQDLNIPDGEDWTLSPNFVGKDWSPINPYGKWEFGTNDQFAIGRSHIMDIYCNIYHSLRKIEKDTKYYPERILYQHLKKNNIIPNKIDFPVRINNGIDFRRTTGLPKVLDLVNFTRVEEKKMTYKLSSTCQIPNLDQIYAQYFGRYCNGKTFVEIGAHDGESVSNTSCLADAGWRGIYVEPVYEYFLKCLERHVDNDVAVANYAIGMEEGEYKIYKNDVLSSLSSEHADIAISKFKYPEWSTTTCRLIRLESLLNKYRVPINFDLLVVDTEGYEDYVFYSFDLKKWKPRMIIAEITDQHEYFRDNYEWVSRMQNLRINITNEGYVQIYKDDINTIYVSDDFIQ